MSQRLQPHRTDTRAGPADALGDEALVNRKKLALICSQRCPGDVILKTYDFARLVRGSALTREREGIVHSGCAT